MTKFEIKESKNANGTDVVQFIVRIDNRAVSVVIEKAVLESMNAMTFCNEVLRPKFALAAKIYSNT